MTQNYKKFFNTYTLEGRSLYLFGVNNKIRNFCAKSINNKIYDPIIIICIILASIALALDNPLNDPNGAINTMLTNNSTVFTTIFTLEFLLNIITYGFIINGKSSYMRNPWNILDFCVICFQVS